jgi:hypothetical protein
MGRSRPPFGQELQIEDIPLVVEERLDRQVRHAPPTIPPAPVVTAPCGPLAWPCAGEAGAAASGWSGPARPGWCRPGAGHHGRSARHLRPRLHRYPTPVLIYRKGNGMDPRLVAVQLPGPFFRLPEKCLAYRRTPGGDPNLHASSRVRAQAARATPRRKASVSSAARSQVNCCAKRRALPPSSSRNPGSSISKRIRPASAATSP